MVVNVDNLPVELNVKEIAFLQRKLPNEAARDVLIERSLRTVVKCAARFYAVHNIIPLEDYVSVATVGLVRGVQGIQDIPPENFYPHIRKCCAEEVQKFMKARLKRL